MKKTRLFTVIATLALIASASIAPHAAAVEEEPIDLTSRKLGPEVELVSERTGLFLRLGNPGGKEDVRLLFEINDPGITGDSYSLIGEVKYEGVEGDSFLETWNHFPAAAGDETIGDSFFSRTLSESGPMGKITGDSDWRIFSLPFYINDKSGRRPIKLTCNAVFAGKGQIEIRNLRLVDGLPRSMAGFAGNGWWSHRAIGIFGAVFGAVFGIWGSLVRYFAGKGVALAFARRSLISWIVLGTPSLFLGFAALALGQPFYVWFFILLFGGLMAVIGAWELAKLRKLETNTELRRMKAADL